MTPFLNQSRTKVSPLDEDQGLAPEDHQRASELLWKHGQPYAVWMRGNISVLHDEEGCRPFHSEKRSGVSPRPRFRPWMTSRARPAAMKKRMRVMARPKKNADERRTERFNLRYTVAERETVRDLARRYGLDEMEFQRRRILGTPLPSSSAASVDPALIATLNRHAVALAKIGNNVNQLAAATHQNREYALYWREIGAQLEQDLAAARAALSSALEAIE